MHTTVILAVTSSFMGTIALPLWTEYLCPLKTHMLKPNQRDGIEKQGFGVIRSRGWSPYGISALVKEPVEAPSPLPPCQVTANKDCYLSTRGPALTRHQGCQCLYLEVLSLQNEKYLSAPFFFFFFLFSF